MPRVLYIAFDIVPSTKGASTHILHNIRGLVNGQFDVHLLTPNDAFNVTRDYIASLGLSRKLVTVIPNGVSPSDFPTSPLPSRAGRVLILLHIGTLADWQGLDVVIKALPKIIEQPRDCSTCCASSRSPCTDCRIRNLHCPAWAQ